MPMRDGRRRQVGARRPGATDAYTDFYADLYAIDEGEDPPMADPAPPAHARAARSVRAVSWIRRSRPVLVPVLGVVAVCGILLAGVSVMATGTGNDHAPARALASPSSGRVGLAGSAGQQSSDPAVHSETAGHAAPGHGAGVVQLVAPVTPSVPLLGLTGSDGGPGRSSPASRSTAPAASTPSTRPTQTTRPTPPRITPSPKPPPSSTPTPTPTPTPSPSRTCLVPNPLQPGSCLVPGP
jgi:hypothetical protein